MIFVGPQGTANPRWPRSFIARVTACSRTMFAPWRRRRMGCRFFLPLGIFGFARMPMSGSDLRREGALTWTSSLCPWRGYCPHPVPLRAIHLLRLSDGGDSRSEETPAFQVLSGLTGCSAFLRICTDLST